MREVSVTGVCVLVGSVIEAAVDGAGREAVDAERTAGVGARGLITSAKRSIRSLGRDSRLNGGSGQRLARGVGAALGRF